MTPLDRKHTTQPISTTTDILRKSQPTHLPETNTLEVTPTVRNRKIIP